MHEHITCGKCGRKLLRPDKPCPCVKQTAHQPDGNLTKNIRTDQFDLFKSGRQN